MNITEIIGRKREITELMELYHRSNSQLVAVYGRRRVGKTFLIRELFKDNFAFSHTGVSPVELQGKSLLKEQLKQFALSLKRYGMSITRKPADWTEAFELLERLLSKYKKKKRIVVFLDELPWMSTPRSGFITAFESFWNGWGAAQSNLMLIVCGSATSWMKDNFINNYGGLYDRVNAEIELSPFTLNETEQLLRKHNVLLQQYDIAQLYMAIGGIPMYLNYVTAGRSLAQCMDELFFNQKAKLREEFTRLFASIFNSPQRYEKVVRVLATKHIGFTREGISQETGIDNGRELTEVLRALEASDFICKYKPFENDKRHLMYRLSDPFCRFWLNEVEGKNRGDHWWQEHENRQELNTWRGIAFEELCMNHIPQIKQALQVAGVASEDSPWTSMADVGNGGMQIDLIINRTDRVLNVCEMKFCGDEFIVSAEYERVIRGRVNRIVEVSDRRTTVQSTLITTFGLKQGMHSGVFQQLVTLADLFA